MGADKECSWGDEKRVESQVLRVLVHARGLPDNPSAIPLRDRPDPNAAEVFHLPLGVIAEVTLQQAADREENGNLWASVDPGELLRFGAPAGEELWLHVDGHRVEEVGIRQENGDVCLSSGSLPAKKAVDTVIAKTDPLDVVYPSGGVKSALSYLDETITDAVLQRLHSDGFAIVDDALPQPLRDQLREEMEVLLAHDQYWESQSYGSSEGALHHSIVETTLDFKEVPKYAPTFALIQEDQGLLRRLRRMPTLSNLRKQHLRMQVNKGNGGCYTMHTDSGVTESDAGAQVLKATALFYLNQDWQRGDGGELRLFPFPRPPVTIPPLDGRLVLFEPRMVHEVLPNFRKRYCFTLWCAAADDEASRNSFLDMDLECVTGLERAVAMSEKARRDLALCNPVAEQIPPPLRALFLPEVRPIIVRYVWRSCELESAEKSHNDGPQKREMLEGIAYYHREMEVYNPEWLRHLLESLPKFFGVPELQGVPAATVSGSPVLGPSEIAHLVVQHCPWWE